MAGAATVQSEVTSEETRGGIATAAEPTEALPAPSGPTMHEHLSASRTAVSISFAPRVPVDEDRQTFARKKSHLTLCDVTQLPLKGPLDLARPDLLGRRAPPPLSVNSWGGGGAINYLITTTNK